MATVISSGGGDWEQEKIRDEFDDAWMATIGCGSHDPRYIRITNDIDKLTKLLLGSLFYTPIPTGKRPEILFQTYSQDTGLLMFEQLEGFD